jgi:hypothetical protein
MKFTVGEQREPRPLYYRDRLRLQVLQPNDSDAICPIVSMSACIDGGGGTKQVLADETCAIINATMERGSADETQATRGETTLRSERSRRR